MTVRVMRPLLESRFPCYLSKSLPRHLKLALRVYLALVFFCDTLLVRIDSYPCVSGFIRKFVPPISRAVSVSHRFSTSHSILGEKNIKYASPPRGTQCSIHEARLSAHCSTKMPGDRNGEPSSPKFRCINHKRGRIEWGSYSSSI